MTTKPPASFTLKKQKILALLSVPETEYDDLSPKGSVDVNIRDLIDEINVREGWVTTSSCAGRISVYLDGVKAVRKSLQGQEEEEVGTEIGTEGDERKESVKAGGKGGGKWLFVSHDPVQEVENGKGLYSDLFGLQPYDGTEMEIGSDSRLIHFKFEPMILHVLAASTSHAQSILAAGLQAGFRESGALNIVSSSVMNDEVTPMVGIRSMGLGLESIIGCEQNGEMKSMVPEWQLKALVKIGNQRFVENTKRIERFRELLNREHQRSMGDSARRKGQEGDEWEDKNARRARKAEEGRRKAEELKKVRDAASKTEERDDIDTLGI